MLLLCSCLFGIFISHSGASVSLMIKDGVSSFQDGSEVVLICTISPYNNLMTWLVNNDPYADCFKGSCGASSNKPFTFIFNFDENNGEFRLSIESVNTSHAGQLFSCDDGSERKTITFNVTTRDNGQNYSPVSNASTLTTKSEINSPTTGARTKFTTIPFSISSVSILPKSTLVTPLSKRDKQSIASYFVLFIALAVDVLIFSMVMLFHCFFLIIKQEYGKS